MIFEYTWGYELRRHTPARFIRRVIARNRVAEECCIHNLFVEFWSFNFCQTCPNVTRLVRFLSDLSDFCPDVHLQGYIPVCNLPTFNEKWFRPYFHSPEVVNEMYILTVSKLNEIIDYIFKVLKISIIQFFLSFLPIVMAGIFSCRRYSCDKCAY